MRGKAQLQGLATAQKAASQTPPAVLPPGTNAAAFSLRGEQTDSKDQSRAVKSLCDGGQAFQPRVQPGCSVFAWLAFVTC